MVVAVVGYVYVGLCLVLLVDGVCLVCFVCLCGLPPTKFCH